MVHAALLDTQILIWLAQSPDSISNTAKSVLYTEVKLMLSHVSIWEIAIKIKTGKLHLNDSLDKSISTALQKQNLELFPISLQHIYQTQQSEQHHREQFDRLLAAQSILENMPIISSDEIFDQYQVQRIWK